MADRLLIDGLDGIGGRPERILVTERVIESLDGPAPPDVPMLDGAGLIAAPGFIELQVNGIGDADFTVEPQSIAHAGAMLPRHGITSFLPTVVTGPPGTVEGALAVLDGTFEHAVPLGLHVEGPFISPHRLGAHEPSLRRDPDLGEIAAWLRAGVRMITLAPELPNGIEAVAMIAGEGAVAAIGHTDADAGTTQRAIEAGARYATHLFNAMPLMGHRAPGAAGALLADERVTIGLIADGVHVDPILLRIVARAAADRVSLVSDAVATGLAGRALAHRPDDAARLSDGTLAGGTNGLDHVVRTFAAVAGREAALRAVTETPARLLGLGDGRGTLRNGGRADIVLLTSDLEVAVTIVGGRVAFRSPAAAALDPAPG
jgi:N-acetylglucosamine-6-phosphate deacetylase